MTSIRFDFQILRQVKGKLLGGAAGFAVGGPLGALIGAVAGHAIDNLARYPLDDEITLNPGDAEKLARADTGLGAFADSQAAAFTIGVVVLGAKMARENSDIRKDDIETLMTAFRLPDEQARYIEQLFARARDDAGGIEPYAEQLARLFRDRANVLEDLLDGLFRYALTQGGEISPAEVAYLRRISFIFGFSASDFAARAAAHGIDANAASTAHIMRAGDDPFKILGLTSRASNDEIKQAWRRLTREYHPDRLVARNLAPKALAEATSYMATINAAYDEIRRARGLG